MLPYTQHALPSSPIIYSIMAGLLMILAKIANPDFVHMKKAECFQSMKIALSPSPSSILSKSQEYLIREAAISNVYLNLTFRRADRIGFQ